jgi:spermidine/putrescine transport system permease protein
VRDRVRRRAALLVAPGTAWITLTYVVPGLLILVYSFLSPRQGGGVRWEFSLDTYRTLLASDARATFYNNYVTVLLRSVIWAAITTATCFALSLPVAVFIHQRRSAFAKYGLLVAVMIPFWTSMLVRTYALRFLLSNNGVVNQAIEALGGEALIFLNTPKAVILGLVYTALPFMILPLYASVARVDPHLLEAGRDLGAGPVHTFIRVFLPLIRAGTVAGGLMVFVLSVSQFIVPTLLGGGKVNMVANLIELQFGEAFNWPLGAGLAIAFSALTLVTVWLVRRRAAEVELL